MSELRNRAKHLFDLVEAIEVVRMLRNGRPIAEIHPIPSAVLKYTIEALEASALRGMDAIHIGAAQLCEADVFASADARQCAAARAAGLKVVAL